MPTLSSAPAATNLASAQLSVFTQTHAAINTLRPRQNGRHFPDDTLKCIFLNENVWVSIKISLKLVPKGPINNIPALVQIMAWHRPGDEPLSETMLASLLTHICVTRLQWVNLLWFSGAIWWHRFGSTLSQEMDCCFTAPSHYLNQCWLTISQLQQYQSKGNFTRDTSAINYWN